MASSTPGGSSNLGMAPNVGGLLCYVPCCVGLIFSAVVAIVEKQNRFMRFHAFQSLLLHAAAIVLFLALTVVQILATAIAGPLGFLVWLISLIVGFACVALTIFLMIKAYGNEQFELPTIGPMARQWV